MTEYIYLHGFASSPASKKARIFAEKFAARGMTLHVPDLNVPDFEHLTLSAMIARVKQEIDARPDGEVCLIGSSMGGLTALHTADRHPDRISKLLLLAPGFDFPANRRKTLGDEGMAKWRETGYWETFNYRDNAPARIHYELYEDALRYDSYALALDLPILIFHGKNDTVVEPEQSIRFAELRPNVDLRLVESDHELLDQVDVIWEAMQAFFGWRSS